MIEPFVYQKTTAFKERVQIISKVNEIIDSVNNSLTEEEIRDLIESELSNYYTKEEVDDALANIDLTNYYTKSEVYNKSEIDTQFDNVSDSLTQIGTDITNIQDNIDTLDATKQDNISVISPIQINNNVISFKDLVEYFGEQISDLVNVSGNTATIKNDIYIAFKPPSSNDYITLILPKGLSFNWTSSPTSFKFSVNHTHMYSILGYDLFSSSNNTTIDLYYGTVTSSSGLIYFNYGYDVISISKGVSGGNIRYFVRV